MGAETRYKATWRTVPADTLERGDIIMSDPTRRVRGVVYGEGGMLHIGYSTGTDARVDTMVVRPSDELSILLRLEVA